MRVVGRTGAGCAIALYFPHHPSFEYGSDGGSIGYSFEVHEGCYSRARPHMTTQCSKWNFDYKAWDTAHDPLHSITG